MLRISGSEFDLRRVQGDDVSIFDKPHNYVIERYREYHPMRDTIEYDVFIRCVDCEPEVNFKGTIRSSDVHTYIIEHEMGPLLTDKGRVFAHYG